MRGARIGGAIADSANRYGQLLMQLIARQDEQKRFDTQSKLSDTRYNEGIAYRNSRDSVEDARANETAIANATMQGARPARPVGEMLMGMSSVGPLPSPVLHSDVAATPMRVGGQDMIMPKREPLANLSRGGMSFQGVPASEAQRYSAMLPPEQKEPVEGVDYITGEGGRRFANNDAGIKQALSWRQQYGAAGRAPEVAPNPASAFSKLPVEVQKQINQIGPAYSSLNNFENLSSTYLTSNPVKRGLAHLAGDQNGKVAEIQSAQRAVLLSVKELANLGALAGPDMDLVTSLIGDPTDPRQLLKDPQGTLNRIAQARRFLDDKVGALEKNYNITVDKPARLGNLSQQEQDAILRYLPQVRQ
jgi:hypothetical protein